MVVKRKKIGGATLHLLPLDFMAAPQSQHRTVFGIFIFLSFFFFLFLIVLFILKNLTFFYVSTTIFVVGNIPYDATEEQLKEICREVGPVISFR